MSQIVEADGIQLATVTVVNISYNKFILLLARNQVQGLNFYMHIHNVKNSY